MTDKDSKQDQNITPAGEVELDEEELDQVTGGKAAFVDKAEIEPLKKDYGGSNGKLGGIPEKGVR